ncbi:MAG: hypothetical protein K0U70_10015 [Actinomycetia bacterium]|nr:hypothetical protein [Actinomycetes bacterium]
MANNTTRRFTRFVALPVLSAGIIGGAALGVAGPATAASDNNQQNEQIQHDLTPRTGIVAVPQTKAAPSVGFMPRSSSRHHHNHWG